MAWPLSAQPISILDELRYPRRWYTKLITVILALVFFAALSTVVIAGVLTYWIVKPQRTSSEINMESFPGRPDEVEFTEKLFEEYARIGAVLITHHGGDGFRIRRKVSRKKRKR